MSQFYPVTVTDIHHTIRDAVVLTLEPDSGTLRLQNENLLTNLRAEISAYLSDTSALSRQVSPLLLWPTLQSLVAAR